MTWDLLKEKNSHGICVSIVFAPIASHPKIKE